MRYGVWLRNGQGLGVAETVQYAVAAEGGGCDGVFVSDSIWDGFSDPWTVLAAVAVQTTRIRLGTWITPIPQQLPWRLAHTLASLDQLSDGRMILGAGLGTRWDHEMFGGTHDGPALGRRYDEALDIITALWRGDAPDHEGEFFSVSGGKLPVVPVQKPRIPIVIGGWWPAKRPFQRGARWDGIMPNWPALLGDEQGPEGQPPSGRSIAEEFREMLAHYRGLTDDPGEIIVPDIPDRAYRDACDELGVTWLLRSGFDHPEDLLAGPPSYASRSFILRWMRWVARRGARRVSRFIRRESRPTKMWSRSASMPSTMIVAASSAEVVGKLDPSSDAAEPGLATPELVVMSVPTAPGNTTDTPTRVSRSSAYSPSVSSRTAAFVAP